MILLSVMMIANKKGLRCLTEGLASFVMCAVFGAGPSAVIAVGFAALVLGTVLTVIKCRLFAIAFVAVVLSAIQIITA